jgi:uncharacterized protein YkwD
MADRLAHVGINIWVAAENTANGYTTVDRTMAAWMASAGHRDNILTPEVTQIGVGQALGSYPTWVLILFKPR